VTLADAKRRARELQSNVDQGEDPAADRREHRQSDNFSQLAGRWLEAKQRQGCASPSYLRGSLGRSSPTLRGRTSARCSSKSQSERVRRNC
jgi:hypothetical protein